MERSRLKESDDRFREDLEGAISISCGSWRGGASLIRDLHDAPDPLLFRSVADGHRGILGLAQHLTLRSGQQCHQWNMPLHACELTGDRIELLLFRLGDDLEGLAFHAPHAGETSPVESFSLAQDA